MRASTTIRLAAGVLPVIALLTPAATQGATTEAPVAEPAQVEAPVPEIDWTSCDLIYECATVEVPLDYDDPDGETTTLPMKRLPASSPDERIGSVFMNFGGPGGVGASGIQFPVSSMTFGKDVRAKFDIVTVDPRGVSGEHVATCAPAPDTEPVERPTEMAPTTPEQVEARIASDDYIRGSCDRTAPPILDHLTTADVARDMDLIRQAMGDEKLSYYGLSYGSLLGETYASMFPDRVRAMVIDGVIDPVGFTTGENGDDRPATGRWGMAAGIEEALTTAFARCDEVGALRCPLAGNAWERWQRVSDSLTEEPLALPGITIDGNTFKYGLSVSALQLYRIGGVPLPTIELLSGATKVIDVLRFGLGEPAARSGAELRVPGVGSVDLNAKRSVLLDRLGDIVRELHTEAERWGVAMPAAAEEEAPEDVLGGQGAYFGILCADTENPTDPRAWVDAAKEAAKTAPNYGPGVVWQSSMCAGWPGSSDDAYRGPFDTSTPMLIVTNTHDNATPMSGAEAAHSRFPGSRLLTLDSWGHTAIGKSHNCVQPEVDEYLLTEDLPAEGLTCKPDANLYG
ncbi:alpha/beta hydrolase [Solicola gregarius]|uniref:Alpha/beta hydrolase n=1 Tax=Solicola gregarius TaxID=2908642 RepID=A0AA46YNF8_9ACTN|nr:alpha/beta hydrolase [Solicola gregarius]UYM07421.1 alpha/beta hydrolase [Solicola gregarius]